MSRLLQTIGAFFGTAPDRLRVAADVTRRWRRALREDPALSRDLVEFGGLSLIQPVDMIEGNPVATPIDAYRLAYEAGKRDLALTLLSMGGITNDDLTLLMKDQDYE